VASCSTTPRGKGSIIAGSRAAEFSTAARYRHYDMVFRQGKWVVEIVAFGQNLNWVW
jgi:hypothetical protein